jgi:hypothetical protein
VLASNRPLPRPEEGHLLAFRDVGAYGFSMASAYNLWPLPKEVALAGGREVQDAASSPGVARRGVRARRA